MGDLAIIGIGILIFWLLRKVKSDGETFKRIVFLTQSNEIIPFYTNTNVKEQYILIQNNEKYHSLTVYLNAAPGTFNGEKYWDIPPNHYLVINAKPGETLTGRTFPPTIIIKELDIYYMVVEEI